jgi:plastocyanin
MFKPFARRHVTLMLFASLLTLVFVLSACGGSTPQTVNVVETKEASGDVYTCDPTSITISKGDTVNFTNKTDEIQDFDGGDAKKAGVDFKMPINGSTTATFNTAGTFTIKSEKGATITVTVN